MAFTCGFRPATPGAFALLVATILLIVSSVTIPVSKSLYFLQVDVDTNVDVSILSQHITGNVKFGVWGYCLETGDIPFLGSQNECTDPQLGWNFDDTTIGQIVSAAVDVPNGLIKTASYVLVIHPIAAGITFLAFLAACMSHFSRYAMSALSIWLSSLATILAIACFVFDMVAFNIAKSKVEENDQTASLGQANWIVLVAAILLIVSNIALCCGRRIVKKRPSFYDKEAAKPKIDDKYAQELRQEAMAAPWSHHNNTTTSTSNDGGLPSFAEEEHIPLRAYDYNNNTANAGSSSSPHDQQQIPNVGYGQPRYDSPSSPKALPTVPGSTISSGHHTDPNSTSAYSQQYAYSYQDPYAGNTISSSPHYVPNTAEAAAYPPNANNAYHAYGAPYGGDPHAPTPESYYSAADHAAVPAPMPAPPVRQATYDSNTTNSNSSRPLPLPGQTPDQQQGSSNSIPVQYTGVTDAVPPSYHTHAQGNDDLRHQPSYYY